MCFVVLIKRWMALRIDFDPGFSRDFLAQPSAIK
jgi:hypothetical protein